MKRKKPSSDQEFQAVPVDLKQVQVIVLTDTDERRHCQRLLRKHYYLGGLKAVDSQGRWLALLLFSAAAKHLKHRDQWIGWTRAQRDRRLSLVVNNSRFLISSSGPLSTSARPCRGP